MTGVLVDAGTLSLPVGVLRTLHYGVSEVRLYRNIVTGTHQVGKRVSLLGRENTMLVQEAVLLRTIKHDNVAEVYDVVEPVGSDPLLALYEIMMPYYPQGSIYDALSKRGEQFSIGAARDITVAALRGLEHLHGERRILHRDIKPGNLFLTGDRHLVKIGDLGEAVSMDDADSAEPLITPRFWTPPETFNGARYTMASDIYSMGLTLFECMCGPFPYDDYSIDELSRRLAGGRPAILPRHLRFSPQVPDVLQRVARKATRPLPRDRYASSDPMIADLLRAKFIDWSWPDIADSGSSEWAGRYHGDEYRVVARNVRGAGWRVRGEKHSRTGWRLVPHCEFDAAELDQAAELAFSHLDKAVASA